MLEDVFVVLRWWAALFFMGAAAFPLTKRLFPSWYDRGYLFTKAVGLALITYIVYIAGTLRILPFDLVSVYVAAGVTVLLGVVAHGWLRPAQGTHGKRSISLIRRMAAAVSPFSAVHRRRLLLVFIAEEALFLAALLLWSWVKAHEPSIRGLEKFMDYGFMQTALNSAYFPAPDMWFAGGSINYYYFGHLATAILARLSGVPLAWGFNVMLATLFAFTLTMAFSIGAELMRRGNAASGITGRLASTRVFLSGALGAFLTAFGGNMQTLYAFTKGYTGEDVKPFWELLWTVGEFPTRWTEGAMRYWYANATRFIPYTIHEFPSYSFVVSDVHGHVLSLPFVLLIIALLIAIFADFLPVSLWDARIARFLPLPAGRVPDGGADAWGRGLRYLFLGFLVAVLLMTNALDGPIYAGAFGLLLFVFLVVRFGKTLMRHWLELFLPLAMVGASALWTALPFLLHFKSFAEGIGVNCPPAAFAMTKVGPFLFEETAKCQKSPLWMVWMLWGFFWFTGIWLFFRRIWQKDCHDSPLHRILKVFFVYGLVMIAFPEFLYVKDIYPQHFRSNTMFKLGYQAFIWWSLISGYVIAHVLLLPRALRDGMGRIKGRLIRTVFIALLVPQFFLVAVFPVFAVRSYFGGLAEYKGLYGLSWLDTEYPSDAEAMRWLSAEAVAQIDPSKPGALQLPVIAEADGDSYTDFNRMSAFAGTPTVIGWAVHEWLWRGGYDPVHPRREDMRILYTADDEAVARDLISKYGISYIVVGAIERRHYPELYEEKFAAIGDVAFQKDDTTIYDVRGVWERY